MSSSPGLAQRLRNVPVRQLIGALERDGFNYRRTSGSARVYRHADSRRVVIHDHHAHDTLPVLDGVKTIWPDSACSR